MNDILHSLEGLPELNTYTQKKSRHVFTFLELFLLRLALTRTEKGSEVKHSVDAATKLIENLCVKCLLKSFDSENNAIKLVKNKRYE